MTLSSQSECFISAWQSYDGTSKILMPLAPGLNVVEVLSTFYQVYSLDDLSVINKVNKTEWSQLELSDNNYDSMVLGNLLPSNEMLSVEMSLDVKS